MFKKFVQLVSEAVDDGYERGLALFMESLEEDLTRSEVLMETGGVEKYVATLFEDAGVMVDEVIDSMDEEKLDAALMQLKKEGLLD